MLRYEVKRALQAGSGSESDSDATVSQSADAMTAAAQVAKALNVAHDEAV